MQQPVEFSKQVFKAFFHFFIWASETLRNLLPMTFRKQILTYLFLRKRDPNEPHNTNIRLMHGMNRISILVFLFALVVMLFRLFRG
jgi:hypothetical protein